MFYSRLFPIFLLILGGCYKTPPADDCFVSAMVKERIDKEVYWEHLGVLNDVSETLDSLVSCPLTVHSAVQIALINNPEIQAAFEELGIARADFIEAGLLQNPAFEGLVRFPKQSFATINTEFSLVQNVLDLFLIPVRRKVAEKGWQIAELKVAETILNLAFDVQETFIHLQSELAKIEQLSALKEFEQAESKLAFAQMQAGNSTELSYQTRLLSFFDTTAMLSKSHIKAISAKEKLLQLLALSEDECFLGFEELSFEIEEQKMDPCWLEEIALAQRLDLEALRFKQEQLIKTLGLKEWWTYMGAFIGISSEKEPEGIIVTGPTFGFNLPIFNYGQAERERLLAQYRRNTKKIESLENQVKAEVRTASLQLSLHQELLEHYKTSFLPVNEKISTLSQEYYDAMALSVFGLLEAKKKEMKAKIDYVEAVRDYNLAKIALNRSLGGYLFMAEDGCE